jgi:hypothetical protein
MPKKKMPKAQLKSGHVHFVLTKEDLEKIKKKARIHSEGVISHYVREAALKYRPQKG